MERCVPVQGPNLLLLRLGITVVSCATAGGDWLSKPAPLTDPFQLQALAALEFETCWSLPRPQRQGPGSPAKKIRRCWNGQARLVHNATQGPDDSKVAEFSEEFGAESVRHLTGDRKENSGRPLIVGPPKSFVTSCSISLRAVKK